MRFPPSIPEASDSRAIGSEEMTLVPTRGRLSTMPNSTKPLIASRIVCRPAVYWAQSSGSVGSRSPRATRPAEISSAIDCMISWSRVGPLPVAGRIAFSYHFTFGLHLTSLRQSVLDLGRAVMGGRAVVLRTAELRQPNSVLGPNVPKRYAPIDGFVGQDVAPPTRPAARATLAKAIAKSVLIGTAGIVQRPLVDTLKKHGKSEVVQHVVIGEITDRLNFADCTVMLNQLVTRWPALSAH